MRGRIQPLDMRFWIDDLGRKFKVPKVGARINRRKCSHKALRRYIFIRDRFVCHICGAKAKRLHGFNGNEDIYTITGSRMTLDHIKPISKGGTNHPSNLQVACYECNVAKGSMEWVEDGICDYGVETTSAKLAAKRQSGRSYSAAQKSTPKPTTEAGPQIPQDTTG